MLKFDCVFLRIGLGIGGLPQLDAGCRFMNFRPRSIGASPEPADLLAPPHMLNGIPSSIDSSPDSGSSILTPWLFPSSPRMSLQKLTIGRVSFSAGPSSGTSSASGVC